MKANVSSWVRLALLTYVNELNGLNGGDDDTIYIKQHHIGTGTA